MAPAWYPDSPTPATAVPVVVREAGEFENAVITMTSVPPLCVAGSARVNGRPAPQETLFVAEEENGDFESLPRQARSADDGSFRICGLGRGQYRLTAVRLPQANGPAAFGETEFTLSDHDVSSVSVDASPGSPLAVELSWWGSQAEGPSSGTQAEISIALWPVHRLHFGGENLSAIAAGAATVSIPSVISGQYFTLVSFSNQTREYLKDVRYCGQSYLRDPVRLTASRCSLQVIVGADGGRVKVSIADDKGNPLPDRSVVIVPSPLSTEAEFVAARQIGQTDGSGRNISAALAPGKYKVFSPSFPVDNSADCLSRLWREAEGVDDVEVAAGSEAAVGI